MPEQRTSLSTMLIIGAVVIIVIILAGYFVWKSFAAPAPVAEPVVEMPAVVDTTATYSSASLGFSLKYPKDYTADEAYSNTSVNPKKPINGVKFTIPLTMATGTNLSTDSGISVEQLPRAIRCTGDIYLAANVRPKTVIDGDVTYSVASSSDAGAGNLYEETVYAIASSSPCTAVRYFIHSTQIANYPVGTVREFDRAMLLTAFDTIRRSLTLSAPAL